MKMDKKKTKVLIAIIIVGFCLRPSITGLGSVLKLLKADLALSDTASGLLTTLPMITFAAISPLVGRLNNRIGTSPTLSLGFVLIAVGVIIRSFGGLVGLYAGTVLIGSGIACGNVLVPAIIKSEFPEKYGFVTALNSTGLAVSSAIASGINYPLADRVGLGWQKTLCIYAVVALVAIAVWFTARSVSIKTSQASEGGTNLWKSPIAWSVTLFLGIEALVFYSCSAWLSTIFQFKGLDATTAGYYVSCFSLTGIPASFIIPTIAGRTRDQRKVTFTLIGIFLAGIILMALTENPALLLAAALLAGFGCNGGFAMSMAFIGFRTSSGDDAIRLSGMSQSVGYLIAAFGPIGMGMVNDVLGSWNLNLWLVAVLLVCLLIVSNWCARDGTV
ncbi:MAG: MFS transporter [Lachnospiraceae bacterium]|nr:MFS transporter [Lachnospiraceae bacterium]